MNIIKQSAVGRFARIQYNIDNDINIVTNLSKTVDSTNHYDVFWWEEDDNGEAIQFSGKIAISVTEEKSKQY